MAGSAKATTGEARALDLVTIGRVSVDLYGQQIGSRLPDVQTFARSVGGCPANIAIGASRLGLRSALISRVGDEAMGQFVLEEMQREGVDTAGIAIDRERLTALVILAVEDDETFPLVFYRENCADMALNEGDIDEDFVAESASILVTGTHFASPGPAAAQRKAMRVAAQNNAKVIFDIDYRPNLWGLAGHAAGEARYIASDRVSRHLQAVLAECDLIVGTEEEIHIAGASQDTLAALRTIRRASAATIVLKRGPMGCVVFPDKIPKRLQDGIVGPANPVEIYNVLGAGDAFMAGFLRGWLRGEPLATCAAWANACGALVVSRLLCSPATPTLSELRHFLETGSRFQALRHDPELNHVHWSTTRPNRPGGLVIVDLDAVAEPPAATEEVGGAYRRQAWSRLVVEAMVAAGGGERFGIIVDAETQGEAMKIAGRNQMWTGRPVESRNARPLQSRQPADTGGMLVEWPARHAVLCEIATHGSDIAAGERLRAVYEAVRRLERDLVIAIAGQGASDDETLAAIADIYRDGLRPDWWAVPPPASARGWHRLETAVKLGDPHCRGFFPLCRNTAADEILDSLMEWRKRALVQGIVIGAGALAPVASEWQAGTIGEKAAIGKLAAMLTPIGAAAGKLDSATSAGPV